jgi:hypothetical protein
MVKARLIWAFSILISIGIMFFSGEAVSVALLVLVIILPLLTILFNKIFARRVEVDLEVPVNTVSKENELEILLKASKRKFPPLAPLVCVIGSENTLTGESEEEKVIFALSSRNEIKIPVYIRSLYCGFLSLEIKNLLIYDIFGLSKVKVNPGIHGESFILPDTFSMNLAVATNLVKDVDADEYSQSKSGLDPSETFDIREYRPGDSLHRIHWKLSGKFDEILIKEPALPVNHSFLVLLETGFLGSDRPSPRTSDALMEITLSICQQMAEEDINFTIAWREEDCGNDFFHMEIENFDDLTGLIEKLLKAVFIKRETDSLNALYETGNLGEYEHLVYISPEEPCSLSGSGSSTLLTGIICQEEEKEEKTVDNIEMIYCTPENYHEELSELMI